LSIFTEGETNTGGVGVKTFYAVIDPVCYLVGQALKVGFAFCPAGAIQFEGGLIHIPGLHTVPFDFCRGQIAVYFRNIMICHGFFLLTDSARSGKPDPAPVQPTAGE
jgi:hypothetical protein